MKVISPGWGRTGTTSLAAALTALGAGPCLQMNEMWSRPDVAALFVDGRPHDWARELGEWRSTVEWPGCWIWDELAGDRDHAVAAFRRHYAEVRASYPQRVVEWTVTDGWAPLCELLDVPVPDEPFPRLWTRETFG